MKLGKVGIWSAPLRRGDPGEICDAAAELEEVGFESLWIPGSSGGPIFGDVERLLEATKSAVIGTSVLNLWAYEPAEVGAECARLAAAHGNRFLLGIGVSHGPMVAKMGEVYEKPLAKTRRYLDALDAPPNPVPADGRVLAALGPRMLELARDRAAGAHPYLVTPEHTAFARSVLGDGPLLAPVQMVLLDDASTSARETARAHLARYLELPNYTNNLLKFGLTPDDLLDGGTDRFVDAAVAWGNLDAIARRIDEHLAAGADHVALQVVRPNGSELARDEWRRLARLIP
jgi:probable F420-dependent oxidoreductase